MKRLLFLTTLILVLVLITACGEQRPPETVGAQGPPGPQGLPGEPGPQGLPGIDGRDGEDGVSYTPPQYVGASICRECHAELYESFRQTGHPYILNPVINGEAPNYPFSEVPDPPAGYTWNDILYVVGGYAWKARFVDRDGLLITGAENDTTQYNLFNKNLELDEHWAAYHPGEETLPYNCGTCHTTGYSPEGNQNGLPGLSGTWAEPGVQCEACHGPGSNHVNNPYLISLKINRDAETCGTCHRRNVSTTLEATNGLLSHHDSYPLPFEGKKRVMDCVTCHDPHQPVKYAGTGIKTRCESCHFEQAEFQKVQYIRHAGGCINCHMPRLIQNAVADPAHYTGDVRTHLMAINPFSLNQFDQDGTLSGSYISLNFACKSCHYPGGLGGDVTDERLTQVAIDYHARDEAGTVRRSQ